MLSRSPLVAFVPTTDLDRAVGFYVGALGLELLEHTAYAAVVDAMGTPVRITLVEALETAPFTVLGWLVEDLDGELAALIAQGVQPLRYEGMDQDDAGAWTAPGGARIAWLHDPDGNVLSLTSSATSNVTTTAPESPA
jgi:catechol 2,3-dioxygenase-like lactoylglutathione lyase family enzyme